MFDWIKLALGLLQLVNWILERVQTERLLTEGEQRAVAKALVENARRAGIGKKIDEKFEKATDIEVLEELKNDFRD